MKFTVDAFGQRVLCQPRLSFMAPKPAPAGGGGPKNDDKNKPKKGDPVELDGETFNFPADTAIADMKPEEQAEYWRHQSKKQQKLAKEAKPADYAQLQAAAAKLEKLERKKLPKQERKHQREVEDARREGENIGAERYLKDAVQGRFQGLTGMKSEDAEKIFAHLDVRSFIDDEGNLDDDAIAEYAVAHGSAGGSGGHGPDPVRDSQRRQKPNGSGEGGQSMKERREATRDRLTKKNTSDK